MRGLASFVENEKPDVLAICEIGSGDALSLATRFALHWAYRGRQALFWNERFNAGEVHDLYLPGRRRGFVRVDGMLDSQPCTLVATQLSDERTVRIPELRFARAEVRSMRSAAIVFAHLHDRTIAFDDLGLLDVTPEADSEERVYLRGIGEPVVVVRA